MEKEREREPKGKIKFLKNDFYKRKNKKVIKSKMHFGPLNVGFNNFYHASEINLNIIIIDCDNNQEK